MVREGVELMPASWEKALAAAAACAQEGGRPMSALAGGETTNEEAFLLAGLVRDALGSSHLSSRPGGDAPLDVLRSLADPALQATVPDLEFAHTVLLLDCDPIDDAPILDLRIRKGVRRQGTKVVVASARPTALDPSAAAIAALRARRGRGVPGRARRRALGRRRQPRRRGQRRGHERHRRARVPRRAARAGEEIVILYSERAAARPGGPGAAQRRLPAGPARRRRRWAARDARPRPTAAACARRASPPATAPASRRWPSPAMTRTGSPRGSPTASSHASGCTTPTRCAPIPTARCGTGRCAPRRP